jgi:hypothetical protein
MRACDTGVAKKIHAARQLSLADSAACSVIGMNAMAKNTPGPAGAAALVNGSCTPPGWSP